MKTKDNFMPGGYKGHKKHKLGERNRNDKAAIYIFWSEEEK